ncbi:tumor necrosis factor alpha-induced protein 3-like isoform X6 [Ostrea edulis]|uniref:tumor necrosis factor alpha-induced protein 3-like isoform X6 n=1 Tax=Ostrea edulis TaxID=37623 RepID=UPI0024AF92F9|nr:tumor necrosis factor alpha-induced protein 3-like isoform X6 [Ostrea edulis]
MAQPYFGTLTLAKYYTICGIPPVYSISTTLIPIHTTEKYCLSYSKTAFKTLESAKFYCEEPDLYKWAYEEIMNTPPFKRKFADSSPTKVRQLLEQVQKDVNGTNQEQGKPFCFKTFHFFSALLPCLTQVSEEFKHFYNLNILDLDVKDDLQKAKVINWCRTAKTLYPLRTRGDGNCLLHAVSLFLWGIEDNDLLLRRLLYLSLVNDTNRKFHKRWVLQQRNMALERPSDFNPDMNSKDMDAEWENVLKAAEDRPLDSNGAMSFYPLEGIHLYVLANILKRPLIVLSERSARTVYGQSMQKDSIGGIYLPLEWKPSDTCKSPITIAYSMNHFAPLLPQKMVHDGRATDSEYVIPLVYHDFEPVVLKFLLYSEESVGHEMINGYLDTKNIPMTTADSILQIPVAKANYHINKPAFDIVQSHFEECQQIYQMWILEKQAHAGQPQDNLYMNNEALRVTSQNSSPQPYSSPRYQSAKCQTPGCDLYGSPAYGGKCSECFKKYTVEYNKQERENRNQVLEPSAPLASMPYLPSGNYCQLSIMDENCQNFAKCGNKTSVNTYPVCYECRSNDTPLTHSVSQEISSSPPRAVGNEPVDESKLFGEGDLPRPLNFNVIETSRPGPSSARTEQCLSPSCENPGHTNYNNFCKECFSKHQRQRTGLSTIGQEGPSSQTYLLNFSSGDPSGGTPSPGDSDIHDFEMVGNRLSYEQIQQLQHAGTCKFESCQEFGHVHFNGYCENCFHKTKATHSTPASTNISKILCSIPGCREERIKNDFGLCLQCFLKNKPSCAEVSKEPIPPPDNSTLESKTPLDTSEIPQPCIVTSSKDKVQCVSPMCGALIYPPKQLCDRCMGILQREHAENNRSRSLEVNRHRPVAMSTAPMRNIQPVVVTRQNNTAPHLRPGLNCLEPGCDKFGDPSMSYRCTEHYRQAIQTAPPPRSSPYRLPSEVEQYNVAEKDRIATVHTQMPTSLTPQQYNIPVTSTGASGTGRSQYIQAMQKVEGSRKGKKCKTPSCNNYGNSSKRGYCNACFIDRTVRREPRHNEHGEYSCC